jgi:hypothetical protein
MSDELQRIIEAERAAPPQPPVGSASAGWQRLQRSVIAAAPAPFDLPPAGIETLAVAKTGAGLGLVGKVLVTAALAGGTTTAVVVTRTQPERAPTAQRAVHDEPSPVRTPAASVPTPVAIPPAVVIEAEAATAPAVGEVAELLPTERTRKPKTTPVLATPPIVDASGLERERNIVAASQRALADGRPSRALDLLDQHARTFPHGAMAEDRDALRVVALCAAGRTEDAEKQRTKFFRRWPKSLHASRVRTACAG